MATEQPDLYLVQHVLEALAQDPRVSELHVDVTISGDRVFVTGTVPSEERRSVIEAVVAELVPDHAVTNHIRVEPIAGPPEVESLG
jgi:osmotically-inducible protein OsmY